MMKRWTALLLALTLCLAGALALAAEEEGNQEEKVLNIFTWDTYIDQDTVLTPFTERTGIKINYTTFNSNEEMYQKLQVAGGGDYDIVLASDYMLNTSRKAGLLQPLNKELLPNYKNLKASFLSQYYDPDNEYVVPYVGGTPLIVYDPARVDFEIEGYADLWNPELKNSIVVMDDARNIIGITLKTLGYSMNTTDDEALAEAKAKLFELRGNIRVFDYDTQHLHMISGETSVGYMFTPFIAYAMMDRPELEVVYPKEGMGFGIDGLVIPVNAPHPENAHLFLNFLMEPEIAAQVALVQQYRNPNEAADALLPDSYKGNMALNIPDDILADYEFIEDLGPENEAKFQDIWTEFKQYQP